MSTTETTHNKEMLRRFHEALNSQDMEVISKTMDEVVQPDVLIRTPLPLESTGVQAVKEVFEVLLRAFPDLHVSIEDLIAEGDKVVSRNVVTGTNLGEYMGRPPTGKPVTYNEMFVVRFRDGRVAETWAVVDVLAQLRQLGMLPA
ncbi:ester cyclase [Actinomadura sp. CNU-125]|uniref:ester cyclase n=1 Tax=Actinomadura sp. CNU-125 TaxID=1904961 RepID=UPI00095E822D|nr:ester cyclase [Actinomadura sp. CNU-125]OLT38253.1 ester cyclase [Actinomadura sp. CNU-125]